MHRSLVGTCQIDISLTPAAAWAIYDGQGALLAQVSAGALLPASSLKGVLRATAERILRSLHQGRNPDLAPLADATFVAAPDHLVNMRRGDIADSDLNNWHERCGRQKLAGDVTYPALSAASQLFGATVHAGLITIDDLSLARPRQTNRAHAAIDRFTGAANLFNQALVTSDVALETQLTITNFALWHVALLGLVFQELNRGYQGIGSGIHKGQGAFRITARRLTARYPAPIYGRHAGGVISAQAHAADAPPAVREERNMVLLRGTAPTQTDDWRDDGLVTVGVGSDNMDALFRAAVETAWTPWLDAVRQESA